MITLLKILPDKWEQAKGYLRLDLEAIEAAMNQRWSATFGATNLLNPDTIQGWTTTQTRYISNEATSPAGWPMWAQVNLSNGVKNRLAFSNFVAATAGSKLIGRRSGSAGDFEEISLGTGLSMSGTVLSADFSSIKSQIPIPDVPYPDDPWPMFAPAGESGSGSSVVTGPAQASAASKLFGRGDSGAGDWEEIALGSGLTMTGTTLSSSGGGGGGPFPSFTAPVDGDFAWINQGGAAVSAGGDSILLTGPATAGDSLRIRKQTAPGTPYTLTVYIQPITGDQASGGSTFGIGFRQSSDGKLALFMLDQHSTPATGNIYSIKFTDATTFSATYTTSTYGALNLNTGNIPIRWLRIADDAANRIISWSADGITFTTFHTIGRTDFLTADEILYFVNSADAAIATSIRLWSWLEA